MDEKYPRNLRIRQLVVFSILMENGRGIRDKSREYIEEKFGQATSQENPEVLLDMGNLGKFKEWCELWEPRESHG